jgi:hypothetical protein
MSGGMQIFDWAAQTFAGIVLVAIVAMVVL